MNFNFIHPALLLLINCVFILVSTSISSEKNKNKSLENIFISIIISTIWLAVGVYTKTDIFILVVEALAIGMVLLGVILKINLPGGHKIFDWTVPGHGAPESKRVIVIKKIIFYLFITVFILFIIGSRIVMG